MKYKAIIFDLFGTLIENLPGSEFERTLAEVASIVSADKDRFTAIWNGYFDELMTGKREVSECLRIVCRNVGLAPEEGRLVDAYKLMTERVRAKLEPPPDVLAILSHLAAGNHRVGLVSNCSSEVPVLWKDSLLAPMIEKPVFSCSVGLKKPDPRIFLLATASLGVKPTECLFIDDNLEPLEGAATLGMTAILVQDIRFNKSLVDSNGWSGQVISSIRDLPVLLDESEKMA